MSLYFHNIWIHWPTKFNDINFAQHSTDIHEAWLSTAKRLLRYVTNRKKHDSLVELTIRIQCEYAVQLQLGVHKVEKVWNRIESVFHLYTWKEYEFDLRKFDEKQFKSWRAFIVHLAKAGFSGKVDFEVTNNVLKFKTLPFFEK